MMQKLDYSEIKDQSLVDIRSQYEFQEGHVKNALNLNPGNFKTYAKSFLPSDQPIVFIVEDTEDIEALDEFAKESGFTEIDGYLLAQDIPNEELEQTETIPANAFFKLKEDYILLDVRHPDEITRPAPKENLVNIPLQNLAEDYVSLDKNKDIYTLCGSGNRSTAAASYLASKGFNSTVIEGGMKNLQEI